MQVTDKLTKALTEAKYLNADNVSRYRCIMRIFFENYEKYISRPFPDKLTAMQDKEVISTRCFLCGANTKRRIPWFSVNNGKHYYTVVCCKTHGYLKGKIRMRKSVRDDCIYVVKTLKSIDENGVTDILKRKQQTREVRKERRHRL